MAYYSLIVFEIAQQARDYRHTQGRGGWIFEFEGGGPAVLFPPHMTPTAIFRHPLTAGRSGRLIGSA